jgi:hypothetical protein
MIDLVLDDVSKRLNSVVGGGRDFDPVVIVNPKHSVFRLELDDQFPKQFFVTV